MFQDADTCQNGELWSLLRLPEAAAQVKPVLLATIGTGFRIKVVTDTRNAAPLGCQQ
ncbi:MAG: hypothetical protein AW07_04598 [Candidatus Accumulibacter sp. SK-11]|nr:MAG: hypothetical protein AW07_04598 [Candidatus Accumulibacter sp. SK-11]